MANHELQFDPKNLDFLLTKEEAVGVIEVLDEVAQKLYNAHSNIERTLADLLPLSYKDKIIELAKGAEISLSDKKSAGEFLSMLAATIKKIPVVRLHLAFNPTEENIQAFSGWILQCLKKHVLLDIVVEERILGGIVLEVEGIYKDYSLKKIIEEKYSTDKLL